MQDWIINVMNHFGYAGIALLIAIENLFPPIPSEVILTFGGFMTSYTTFNEWGVILAATIGSLTGAVILYGVGRLLSEERIGVILDGRAGRVLRFKKADFHRACEWFNKRGRVSVLFCRCIPVVRSLISIPAGMAKMKFGLFMLYTAIGSLVWNTVLVFLGAAAGDSWENIVAGTDKYAAITIVVLAVAAIVFLSIYVNKRFIKKK
jgi:membrane protein DedA with SNARE-associated domain